jgi:exosortase/archaeosortase family protein
MDKQLRFRKFDFGKGLLVNILILTAFLLLLLPFWNIGQDLLTRLIMKVGWYKLIAETIVPYEIKIIGMLLHILGLPILVGNTHLEWVKPDHSHEVIYLVWNCIGWQSGVFLTLFTGLSGKHTWGSKLETFLLGLGSIYLVNIVRLCLVIIIYYFFGRLIGGIFHDYISNILTLAWLFFFWWFANLYVLEDKS